MMYIAFIELRSLRCATDVTQAASLADAFHNLPTGMWNDFDLAFFRDSFLLPYRERYPDGPNYMKMVDEVIALGD